MQQTSSTVSVEGFKPSDDPEPGERTTSRVAPLVGTFGPVTHQSNTTELEQSHAELRAALIVAERKSESSSLENDHGTSRKSAIIAFSCKPALPLSLFCRILVPDQSLWEKHRKA
jgi:hypothetical protein